MKTIKVLATRDTLVAMLYEQFAIFSGGTETRSLSFNTDPDQLSELWMLYQEQNGYEPTAIPTARRVRS